MDVFHGVFNVGFGMVSLLSFSMECLCMARLTPAMTVMRGFTFHPLFCSVLISGSYLACMCSRACLGNMLW